MCVCVSRALKKKLSFIAKNSRAESASYLILEQTSLTVVYMDNVAYAPCFLILIRLLSFVETVEFRVAVNCEI